MYLSGQANILNIIGRDTDLKRTAGTNGGEYAGACPFCGGRDRFRVWPSAERPGFWCRVCEKNGDAIEYLRLQGMSFHEACREVGATPERPIGIRNVIHAPPPVVPPSDTWQVRASEWVAMCQQTLWDDAGQRAFDWLVQRGFTRDTILRAGLGYHALDTFESRESWGLEEKEGAKAICLPRGIVIPWMVGEVLWKVVVRRPAGEPRYWTVNASGNALYNYDELEYGKPAVIVEGAFDALAVQQETGIAAVATGTSQARGVKWVAKLALCEPVLVALDDDDGGEKAALWWCNTLQAPRWRPFLNDPAEMLERGVDLVPWIEAGLEFTHATV